MQEASSGIQRIRHRLPRSVRRSHGMDAKMSIAIIIFVILVGIVWACYDDFPD
nr:MAG TPA: SNARE domain [Caudoviricetes sp.]